MKKQYLFNKIILASLILVFGVFSITSAAFNKEINYQGKLTNSAGTAVADGDYNMQFKLYTVSTGGTAIWTETLTLTNKVTVTDGLFSVMLGDVTAISGVDFNQDLYLGVNIGGTGTASWDGEMTPRKQIAAVPSAFEADKLDGQDGSYYLDAANLTGTSLPTITTLTNLTNATTTRLTVSTLFDSDGDIGTSGQVLSSTGSVTNWVSAGGSGTVTSVDMSVPTGLAISGNPITGAGTLALTYDTGYGAVKTASTTAWNTFYNTPSNRITGGTGLSWSSNTLNWSPSGIAGHDTFTDFVSNEHIDWTGASAGTIHATNYVDNNTTYTGGTNLTLDGTTFNVDDSFLTNSGDDTTTGVLTTAGVVVGDGQTVGAATNKWLFDDTGGDITTTGNLGIGVTDPDVALEIYEAGTQLKLSYDATNYANIAVDSAGGLSMVPAVSNATTTIGSGTETLRIDSSGNVGVGVTAPAYQLQLSTDSAAKPGTSSWTVASDERLKDVNGDFTRGLAALSGLYPVYFNYKQENELSIPSSREYVGLIAQDVQAVIPEAVKEGKEGFLSIESDAIFWTMLNAIKELAVKVGSDNITYTRDKIEVVNDTGEAQMKLSFDEENLSELNVLSDGSLSISTTGNNVNLLDENIQVCSGGDCPSDLTLLEGAGNLTVENTAYIAGSLGVGTSEPQRIVDILGTQTDPQLRISYNKDLYSEFNVSATGDLIISAQGGDISILNENLRICSDYGCPSLANEISNTGNLVVENSLLALGNMGVGGTVSPDYTLDVQGTLRAYGITDASDIRLKTNIRDLQNTNVLENIQKLRGVKFEWKDSKFGTGDQIGFIAQEVEKIYPELVDTDEDGYKSVQYGKMTAVIIEAIKGLISKDDELENRIKALEDALRQ